MTALLTVAALKGTIVLGAAWIATLLLRRSSADLRHRIWLAAIIAMALLMIPLPAPAPMRLVAAAEFGTGQASAAVARSFPLLPVLWAIGAALVSLRLTLGI